MKKLALTTVCALSMAGGAFAQGFLSWQTISFSAMTAVTNTTAYSPFFGGASTGGGAVGATATTANGFYYELLYNTFGGSQATIPSLASLLTWQDTGLSANNSVASAGRLVNVNPTTGATVPWAAGATDSVVLVGWSANLGTQWSGVGGVSNLLATTSLFAAGSEFGVSTTGYLVAGASSSSGTIVFANSGAGPTGLPIFSLNTPLYALPTSVPEPATMALAGLSLLLFRRQRK